MRCSPVLPLLLGVLVLAVPTEASAARKMFPKTPSGKIEIKTIPPSVLLTTEMEGDYFDRSNDLFRRLFDYIKSNSVSMTAPVEGYLDGAGMSFYVGPEDRDRGLADQGGVAVLEVPERLIAAIGGRGSYRKKNVMKLKGRLEEWLEGNPDYGPDGEAYAVFWNAPFIPWFLRTLEVHIPVRRIR